MQVDDDMMPDDFAPKPLPGWRRFLGNSALPVPTRRPVGLGLLMLRPAFNVHRNLDGQLAARRNAARMRGDQVKLGGRDPFRLRACR